MSRLLSQKQDLKNKISNKNLKINTLNDMSTIFEKHSIILNKIK